MPGQSQQCAYGQQSCTVCNSSCQSVAGQVVGYCGDGIKQAQEECDGQAQCPSRWAPTFPNLVSVTQVDAGDYFTCARLNTGSLRCWGWNFRGQLGDGTYDSAETPQVVQNLVDAAFISTFGALSCAVRTNGLAMCWGVNLDQQVGNQSSADDIASPVTVTGLTSVEMISASTLNTCALLQSGEVKCWGANHYGQLGNGTTTDSATPVSVLNL